MESPLMADDEFASTTFLVIDFEGTTPKGRQPEPIEVATLGLRIGTGGPLEVGRYTTLIKPPSHAPITPLDTAQTGITAQMVETAPNAGEALAKLDARLPAPPYLLVAHNAPTEAGILYAYRAHAPRLARTPFLDTVKLARAVYPGLPTYNLDALLAHRQIPAPADRHRAMPDVEVTAQLFVQVILDGATSRTWRTLAQIRSVGGSSAKAARPVQEGLFDAT